MDIQMPHVSGYELIGELKLDEALCQVPIMAVTAYAGREDEERIRAAGAGPYPRHSQGRLCQLGRFFGTRQRRRNCRADPRGRQDRARSGARSEEHTSELQSLMRISYAVFCLKNKKTKKKHNHSR